MGPQLFPSGQPVAAPFPLWLCVSALAACATALAGNSMTANSAAAAHLLSVIDDFLS
jgi:hypothetical protein